MKVLEYRHLFINQKTMSKTAKIVIGVVVIVLIILALTNKKEKISTNNDFTVGAALSLSGPVALWGETVKNGMELALEGKSGIKVVYEDTKGTPADGVSAFNRLQEKNPNLFLSVLSAVSVPLSKIAQEKKIPLLVTLVSASSPIIVNDYTSRYYTDPAHYAGPSFTDPMSPVVKANKIAVLYRNDELGVSVFDEIKSLSKKYNKEIVYSDLFKPAETDFSTLISKVKASGADVMLFVPATPGEAISIVKTAARLKLTIPFVETSAVFADLDNRKQVEGISFYSTSYEFSLGGERTTAFRKLYTEKYGKEPNFGAAFGYDMVNLIDSCKTQGVGSNRDIRACINKISSNSGIAGVASQVVPGDFVVTLHLEKVN